MRAYAGVFSSVLDAARCYISGYFTEELSEEEIAAIEPGMRHEWMQYSGHAGYDGDGDLVGIYLTVSTTIYSDHICSYDRTDQRRFH